MKGAVVTQGEAQVISQDVVSDETLLNVPRGQKLRMSRDCTSCIRHTATEHAHILTQKTSSYI